MHVTETVPYPWPWDGKLDAARLALVVTGAQHAWTSTPGAMEALASIDEVAGRLRPFGVLVVWIQHHLPSGARACAGRAPEYSSGPWHLVLEPGPDDLVVESPGIDAFYGSQLESELRGRDRDLLVLAGCPRETTVDSTMRDANDRGFECIVARDLTASARLETGFAADASCAMSGGIFGTVGTATALIDALERVAT